MIKVPNFKSKTYIVAAALVGILSVVLYYALGVSPQAASAPLPSTVDLGIDKQAQEPSVVGYNGFFSIRNPLAWFMFGAWFALLLFFVLSLMSGHAKR